jgi:hypothetical protein
MEARCPTGCSPGRSTSVTANTDPVTPEVSAPQPNSISGYPLRPLQELPYRVRSFSPGHESAGAAGHGILGVVWDLNQATGHVSETPDRDGVPCTVLGYHNGPGYRGAPRVDPRVDPFRGMGGAVPSGPSHPAYFEEAAVPLGSETPAGEDVRLTPSGQAPSWWPAQ